MEGEREIAALGALAERFGPLFVKPNTLGAKIGIFADSLCGSLAEAKDRARRIQDRYRDRALIQPFVEGDDVRVSFIDLGGDLADQLGVERIVKNPASETGGAFLTMKDNETLSGAKDTAGARGGFGGFGQGGFRSAHGRFARERMTSARSDAVAEILDCFHAARAACRTARLLLDRLSHRRRGPADLFRIRGLPGGDHLRLPELSRPPGHDARGGAGESDADRVREALRDGRGLEQGGAVSAPVTGSVDLAIRGDMLLFVGGEDADIEAVRRVLHTMGETRRVGAHVNG